MWISENNLTNTDSSEYGMLEQILSPTNLNQAFKRVRNNRGSGGVDKMEVESMQDYLVNNKEKLLQSILDGSYRPNPVRRVEIPKEKGKRSLGIPKLLSYYMSSQFVLGMFSDIPNKYLKKYWAFNVGGINNSEINCQLTGSCILSYMSFRFFPRVDFYFLE